MKTRRILSVLTAAALLLASAGCSTEAAVTTTTAAQTTAAETTAETTTAAETSEETTTSAEDAPATEETREIETYYNPNFKIEVLSDGIKKVTDGDGRELVLVPKTLSEVPAEYSESLVVRTPVENAVFLSATQVCTFRTVDDKAIIDAIGGVEGGAESWADVPVIAEGLANGTIADVGGDGMGEPNYEIIQSLNPEIVFVYSGEYGQLSQMAKFDELGIPYAVDNEYMESDYMAKMEWLRFILTFFNADDKAETAMSAAKTAVEQAKAAVEGKEKPTVAVFMSYDGVIYHTGDSSWVGALISDMGGVNAFSGLPDYGITYEEAFEKAREADIIVYSSTAAYTPGLEGVISEFPQLTECKAYENNRVYQYSDAFWNSIDQTDILACDFGAILYPEVFEGRELTYYVKLDK
ncbi:MAG: ABC transporter substrate-binding protein [Ruminiclostridium sp.]